MKNLIKTIITSILTAAILITGISVDTTTVTAATTKGGEFQNGSSVTLKPGDSMKLTVTDNNNEFKDSEKTDYDIVEHYEWSSSDTSVIKVETDFYDEKVDWTMAVILTAAGSGTATVTGKVKSKYNKRPDITMTVTVTLPKATAKQKKCKHKFKTTKKATCQRAGVKTCKKCKFQKAIKTVPHNYVEKKMQVKRYNYYDEIYSCNGNHATCTWHATIRFDAVTGDVVAVNGVAGDWDLFVNLFNEHCDSMRNEYGILTHVSFGNAGTYTTIENYLVEETIKQCAYCDDIIYPDHYDKILWSDF